MTKLKTVNIKGKEYVEVSTRILAFNELCKNGSIRTETESINENLVRCRATVTPDCSKPERYFTGHAEEDRRQGNINKTNAVENCETSAVGRALAMMGIGIIDGVASADEVRHAIQKQTTPDVKVRAERLKDARENTPEITDLIKVNVENWKEVVIHFGKNQGKKLGELDQRTIGWYSRNWKPLWTNPQDAILRKALTIWEEMLPEGLEGESKADPSVEEVYAPIIKNIASG